MPAIIRRYGREPCRRSNIAAMPAFQTSSVLWRPAKAVLILNDDIKGNALDLLWPDHMTAAELFSLLTPTADNYFGSYALFQMTLPDTLKSGDLLPALEWATQFIAQSHHIGGYRAKRLADAIMFKVWQAFENPELTQPFLDHIAVRLRQHGDLCRGTDHDAQTTFLRTIRDDAARRHKFLLALCARALDRIEVYSYRRVGLLLETDLEWLLSIAPGGSAPAPGLNAETLCNLIECAFVVENVAHFEALYAAAERWPALRARYAYWFDGVRLDSPECRAGPSAAGATARAGERPSSTDRARSGQPKFSRSLWKPKLGRVAGLVAAHVLLDADAGKSGVSATNSTISSPRCRDGARPTKRFGAASSPGPNDTWSMPKRAPTLGWGVNRCLFQCNDIAGFRAFILLRQVSSDGLRANRGRDLAQMGAGDHRASAAHCD